MRVFVARFFTHMVGEVVQVFWTALQGGEFITDAAAAAGTYRKQGTRWVIANGGVRPRRGRNLAGRYLGFAEREEIALAGRLGSRCAGLPVVWGVVRRRFPASCAVTRRRRGGIGRPVRTRRPGFARAGPSRRSWPRIWCCGSWSSSICS